MDIDEFKPLRYRNRWFCYLDLLGFTALVNDKNIEQVIPLYKEALHHLEHIAKGKKNLGIIYSWFSDTFIIYSRGEQAEEFSYVEQTGRSFFQNLILHHIPVRGAITYGALYSQSSKNIFVGPALIDAYNYGEKQNWIGFLLTPNAAARLAKTSIRLSKREHYRLVTEAGIIAHEPSTPVYAFAFNNETSNGTNPYISALEAMRASAPPSAKAKYDKTIAFANEHNQHHATRGPATPA